jgi:hypothetical protein
MEGCGLMNTFEEITVRIRPMEEEIIVEEKRGGLVSVKRVLPEDLMKTVEASIKDSKIVFTSFLPENSVSVTISDRIKEFVFLRPAVPADITYFNTLYERFPLPRIAFAIGLRPDGKTSSYRLAVTDDAKPSPDMRLYQYPFSNVYKDTGICIGSSNEMPVHKSPRTLAALADHILSLPNNDHNFSAANNNLGLGYRDLLEHLKDKDSAYYYENVLIPRDCTLQDFIENKVR